MKNAAVCLVCAGVMFLACAGIPRISPVGANDASELVRKSRAPFLKGKWRLVHSIEGVLPGGSTADMIGVSLASPDNGTIHSTLMSIEGLVLLDAVYDSKLVINRGIGPLAKPELVMGMIRDIRLMLFAPRGTVTEAGTLRDGSEACRYHSDEGDVVVILSTSGITEVRSYDRSSQLLRTVRFMKCRADGIPERIELTASGLFGYSLRLDLIEAEPVGPEHPGN